MSLKSFSEMQKIAQDQNVDLITRQILVRKNCQITQEDAEIRIPKDKIKNTYGISLNPKFVTYQNATTIILQNVGNLYDLSPEEYTNIVETLSTIDLKSSSFSAMQDVDEELDEDEEDLLSSFESSPQEFTMDEEEDYEEEDDVEGDSEEDYDVIDYVMKEIDISDVCLFEEIEKKYGKQGLEKVKNRFKDDDSFIYDEEDETITKSETDL